MIVLCGCCSFAISKVTQFIFVVLKEEGQLLQGFMPVPETGHGLRLCTLTAYRGQTTPCNES